MDEIDILKKNVYDLNKQVNKLSIRIKELREENNYLKLKLKITEDSLENVSQKALGYTRNF
jgi:regulator of replication initiation timing